MGVKLPIPLNNLRKAIPVKLDRDVQLEILNRYAPHYPLVQPLGSWSHDQKIVEANLFYLIEHGLLESKMLLTTDGIRFGNIKLTHNGMDFLAGDGGLSAILGVVTIRLHDETIRDLIAARIQASDLPPAEKTGLLDQLRELRGESIKHLTMKLIDAGLDKAPGAFQWLSSLLPG